MQTLMSGVRHTRDGGRQSNSCKDTERDLLPRSLGMLLVYEPMAPSARKGSLSHFLDVASFLRKKWDLGQATQSSYKRLFASNSLKYNYKCNHKISSALTLNIDLYFYNYSVICIHYISHGIFLCIGCTVLTGEPHPHPAHENPKASHLPRGVNSCQGINGGSHPRPYGLIHHTKQINNQSIQDNRWFWQNPIDANYVTVSMTTGIYPVPVQPRPGALTFSFNPHSDLVR